MYTLLMVPMMKQPTASTGKLNQPLTEDQRRRGVDARGDKVQRVDGALPGEAVEDRAGKDRRDDLGAVNVAM